MECFSCPYLKGVVQLSDDRERHIAERHPDLLPAYKECIAQTLVDPDQIRRSARFGNARLFSRWFDNMRGGKYAVVVVISDAPPAERHWIVTAYMTRKLMEGEIEWQKI